MSLQTVPLRTELLKKTFLCYKRTKKRQNHMTFSKKSSSYRLFTEVQEKFIILPTERNPITAILRLLGGAIVSWINWIIFLKIYISFWIYFWSQNQWNTTSCCTYNHSVFPGFIANGRTNTTGSPVDEHNRVVMWEDGPGKGWGRWDTDIRKTIFRIWRRSEQISRDQQAQQV